MLIGMLCRICRCFTSRPRARDHAAKPDGKAGGEPPPEGAGKPRASGKLDHALAAGPGLSDEQVAEVKRLRDEGERLHKTCGHSQSMDTRV